MKSLVRQAHLYFYTVAPHDLEGCDDSVKNDSDLFAVDHENMADLPWYFDEGVLAVGDADRLLGIHPVQSQLTVFDPFDCPLFFQLVVLGLIHDAFNDDDNFPLDAIWTLTFVMVCESQPHPKWFILKLSKKKEYLCENVFSWTEANKNVIKNVKETLIILKYLYSFCLSAKNE